MTEVKRVFQVDGKPFFTLGGQSRNSSGYNRAEAETAFRALQKLHGNTLEIPVYWEQVEPVEGQFDFTSVDELLALAREYGVRLVLLWFGTWKNGNMEYAPAWVKRDPQRFWRVIGPSGNPVWVLSSHCPATYEADERAFTRLMTHLREKDGQQGTVIAVQIQNEPGILGSDRDYGEAGQRAFESAVPADIMARLPKAEGGQVYATWQAAGARSGGTWEEVFGRQGGEYMTAWSIGQYIDKLAVAGRRIYDIPLYINVWLGEMHWRIAGDAYPSGGGVSQALDIFRWATPHVDLIAPDIYIAHPDGYREVCAIYARDDNPLFVPESAPYGSNAWNMFYALADYGAIGYHFFAIEHILDAEGNVNPQAQMMVDSFHATAAAIPLLLKYQGTDQIHAVVQQEFQGEQWYDLDGWVGLVQFGYGAFQYMGMDWRHPPKGLPMMADMGEARGRGLIFQQDENTFYLVGAAYRLHLRRKAALKEMLDPMMVSTFHQPRQAPYISVDEGHFDENGTFVVDRRRNGDETDSGVWVEPDCGVVRVVLTR